MILRSLVAGLSLIATALLSACGGNAADPGQQRVDACALIAPTTTQGVYGCVTSSSDVGASAPDVVGDFGIVLYPDATAAPTAASGAPLASTVSNANGFYEIATSPGTYWLCTSFYRCTSITVATDAVLRRDYSFSVGPGW